jgi:hypothetical protein
MSDMAQIIESALKILDPERLAAARRLGPEIDRGAVEGPANAQKPTRAPMPELPGRTTPLDRAKR